MWPKSYKDYPKDTPLVKQQLQSGKGIIGCEMSELNGWGESYHIPKGIRLNVAKKYNNGSENERTDTKSTK